MKKKNKAVAACILPDRNDARVGEIVISMAGHDEGMLLVIIAGIDPAFVLVADGKRRKLSAPKKKKMQHLTNIARLSKEDTEALRLGKANDSLLRRRLSALDLETLTQSDFS